MFITGDNDTAIAKGKGIQEIWDRNKGEDVPESIYAVSYLRFSLGQTVSLMKRK